MIAINQSNLGHQASFDFSMEEKEMEFIPGDVQNIWKMVPRLKEEQAEDVAYAEQRFDEGKGYLFTNGTGTGKTYVGLGIAMRFHIRGKKSILFIAPTEKKCNDWQDEGRKVGLDIYQLNGIHDKGFDATITTYANFYQNEALGEREWDLVIYDESHYLMQNQQGNDTTYLQKHKSIVNLPSVAKYKAAALTAFYPENDDEDYHTKLNEWEERRLQIAQRIVNKTKVVFLSATPFAYHKSIKYGDGVLFDIEESLEPKEHKGHYNAANGFDEFMQTYFGYRMKYNKLTIPESGVDVNLLERNFFETFVEKGVMSTRQLKLDYDYSRHFVTLDSELGSLINTGMEMFYSEDIRNRYKWLSHYADKMYNYLFVNQLLEVIKARESISRIKEHVKMGRKVVVFHSYNNSTIPHPFKFDPETMVLESEARNRYNLEKDIQKFNSEFPHLVNLDLSGLQNTRKAILSNIPSAREFNGTVPKRKRNQNIDLFNEDSNECMVILIQTKAGREGISAHDTTGAYQRVMYNLGLPTEPTRSIQEEGRIYRQGLKSNAIYEYATLQTNFERITFATKIATRSKTAENLAMGNLARDLETVFKEGYINACGTPPSNEQGTGGKEMDRYIQTISEFDKAKTYYWSRAKKTSSTKSREGVDYFATPEPLGYKILEWLNPKEGERGLEPSAGHGAIARYFPTLTANKFIEPSFELSSQLLINATGDVIHSTYEEFYIGNRFEFIAMNPPFGVQSKTAASHLHKAIKQMSYRDSRLIAIVPGGSSMERRLEEIKASEDFRDYRMAGEILLPSVLFERAGTSIMCRILKIESKFFEEKAYVKHDLTYIKDINEFFDVIEELKF